jgi:outer membrane protein assembly factor BamB
VGNGKVFVSQLDATLVALDAGTGSVVWKVTVDRWQDRWTETMAPLFLNGMVIIGASGGEYQRRGHVRAYDANTGELIWQFNTTAGPGEF